MLYNSNSYAYTTPQPLAEAFITKEKNRLKQNGTHVYLNNNDNFEIELFNPRTYNILVKIKINGAYLPGGGLVLRPGQRHFLDRYLDVARKFMFSTYDIDGGNSTAVAAAAKNGLVEIEFYDEKVPASNNLFNLRSDYYKDKFYSDGNYDKSAVCCDSLSLNGNSGTSTVTLSNFAGNQNVSYTSNTFGTSAGASALRSLNTLTKSSMETGRVEKGGTSDQKFTEVDMDFNWYVTNIVSWQIKPKSTEPVETKDLCCYCTNCGKKLKDKFKFCPACGTKVSA